MADKYCVYMHVNNVNGKRYIGITMRDPLKRWRAGWGYYGNKHFMSAILKYGWDEFSHEVLYSDLDFETASKIEMDLVKKYRSNECKYGYNRSIGGEQPAKGHKFVPTSETIRKMSEAHKGRKRSDDVRAKISRSKKGKSNGREGLIGKDSGKAKQILQMTLDGRVIRSFYGTGEVARELGIPSPSKIGDVCRGTRQTAYGYRWMYTEV